MTAPSSADAATAAGPWLIVYVAEGCAGCVTSRQLVTQLHRQRPAAQVEMVQLDRLPEGRTVPRMVVGTPTYVVDGRVRWLGNPSLPELIAAWDTRHRGRSCDIDPTLTSDPHS